MLAESKPLRRRSKATAFKDAAHTVPPADDMVKAVIDGWILGGLDFPSFRLSLVAKVMDRLTMRQFGGPGELTYPEWRVMSRLFLSPNGSTVRQLADQAWVDRAETSRAVAALEKRGLSHRKANPRDKRIPILFLTDAGRAMYEPIVAARGRFHEAVMAGLTAKEKKELDRILKKLVDRLMIMSKAPTLPIFRAEKAQRR